MIMLIVSSAWLVCINPGKPELQYDAAGFYGTVLGKKCNFTDIHISLADSELRQDFQKHICHLPLVNVTFFKVGHVQETP